MRIDINKEIFERIESVLGRVLTGEVINRGIDIVTQRALRFTTLNEPGELKSTSRHGKAYQCSIVTFLETEIRIYRCSR